MKTFSAMGCKWYHLLKKENKYDNLLAGLLLLVILSVRDCNNHLSFSDSVLIRFPTTTEEIFIK